MPRKLAAFSKNCTSCGKEFWRRAKEGAEQYRRRIGCSKWCSNIIRSKSTSRARSAKYRTPNTKNCEECGESFSRRDGEYPATYRSRRMCSKDCAWAANGRARRTSIEVAGVELSAREVGMIVGVGFGTILARIREGRDPLTGKREVGDGW